MRYLPIFILLSFFISCKKKSNSPAVDSKLILSHSIPVNNASTIRVTTVAKYPCLGYKIDFQWSRSGALCSLVVNGLKAPANCVTGSQVASSSAVSDIKDPGVYNFTVVNGDRKAGGVLTLSDDFIAASYASNDVFSFQYDTLNKIPNTALWGSVDYVTGPGVDTANIFIDSLEELGAQPFSGRVGQYGDFAVQPDRTIKQYPPSNGESTILFVYTYTGDTVKLRGLMDRCMDRYTNSRFRANVHTTYVSYYVGSW